MIYQVGTWDSIYQALPLIPCNPTPLKPMMGPILIKVTDPNLVCFNLNIRKVSLIISPKDKPKVRYRNWKITCL